MRKKFVQFQQNKYKQRKTSIVAIHSARATAASLNLGNNCIYPSSYYG